MPSRPMFARVCRLASRMGTTVSPAAALVVSLAMAGCGGGTVIAVTPTTVTSVSISTTALTFSATIPVASAAQTATLTNTGTVPVNISGVSVTGTGASSFTQTNTCGATLAAGGSCTISVMFNAATAGASVATLTVASDAAAGPVSVTLSGTELVKSVALAPAGGLTFTATVPTASAVQTATLTNTGTAVVNVGLVSITGTGATAFTETSTCGSTLAIGAMCTVSVALSSAAGGSFAGSLTVASDATVGGTAAVALSGTELVRSVTLGPASLTFNATIPTAAAAQTATLTNTGTAVVTLGAVSISGAGAAAFSQTGTCGATLAVGASCTITVGFNPATAGSFAGSLAVTSDATTGGTATVTLTGTELVKSVTLGPAGLAFTATIPTVSAAQTATLTNTGTAVVNLGQIAIGGTGSAAFTPTTTCGATLAVGASCTISVSFTSSTAGSFAASLAVPSDATTGGSATVALTGTELIKSVTLGPVSLTFTATLPTASAAQAATLTNTGTAPVNISGVTFSGTGAAAFSQANNCGTALAVGASCTISVAFNATVAGSVTAALAVMSDATTGGGTAVALSGMELVKSVALSPSSLSFTTTTSAASAVQMVTLTNNGSAVVNLGAVAITGAGASSFSQTSTCGAALAVSASCVVTVQFASAAVGTFAASLSVASDATVGGSAVVGLSGTANGVPIVSFGAPTITFPTMVAGTSSGVQSVTLTNTGTATLTIASMAKSGMGMNLFTQTSTCGTTVAVNASCTISATFSPKVAGTYAAAVTLTDNTPGGSDAVGLSGTATPFAMTLTVVSSSDWRINNGAITLDWSPTQNRIYSMVLAGTTDQLVDTTSGSAGLYMDNAGFGASTGTPTFTNAGTYIDWSITYPSNSVNAYTYTLHYIVTPNDPGFHTYLVVNHATTDIAGGIGQIQWVFRDSLTQFTNTYEVNPSVNSPGVTTQPLPPASENFSTDPGRAVQDATDDLHGFTLPVGWLRNFYTKYDHAGYEYMHQAHGLYGTKYGTWTVIAKLETMSAGPTKQDLYFTGNLLMIEAFSNHEDNALSLATPAGTASSRLFGPFYVHFNTFGQPAANQTGNIINTPADMYADAVASGASFATMYDSETQLLTAGYVPSTGRGTVQVQVNNAAGAPRTAWAVLSDPGKNIQFSSAGYQYWQDISATGAGTFTGVVPGTYRLSVYVLGQWGEYRQEGVKVAANGTLTLPAVTFVPENFGTTLWTIGTPDRSSHEFLHGHFVNGNDDREFSGAWNYWADFAANNGAVVYNATSGLAGPATNDLSKWNYNHWGVFDPGLFGGVYSATDDTTDGYTYAIPAYVASLPGASGTNGVTTGIPAWTVHFATPASQTGSTAQAYVVLSGSLACVEGSYVVTLNGSQLIWHYTNASDCMIRSGLSGYTQWFAMQWNASVLKPAGQDNVMTISVSQSSGAEDDALRMELTNTSAVPATTGWNDYTYIFGNTTVLPNDALPNP
jgi:hypothetical protein